MTNCQTRKSAAVVFLLVNLPGCATLHTWRDLQEAHIDIPERAVAIFFADGMDKTQLHRLLAEGRLPNIQKRFVEGGVRVDHAVTSMPAITYPNAVSLLTGCFPGHHGILGNHWFDRNSLTTGDYFGINTFRSVNDHFRNPTLFEILPEKFSVATQSHTRRGATHVIDHTFHGGIKWGLGLYSMVDERVGDMDRIETLVRQVRRWPEIMLCYFPGLDEVGHRRGSQSATYESALITVDESIGEVCDKLEQLELLDRTYLVLVTDHNHPPTEPGREFDLKAWLQSQAGVKVFDGFLHGKSYADRTRAIGDANVVLINGAYRRAVLHLRGMGKWQTPLAPASVESWVGQTLDLDQLPAVERVAYRAEADHVCILTRDGTATVERRTTGKNKEYRVLVRDGMTNEGTLGDGLSTTVGLSTSADLTDRLASKSAVLDPTQWHDSRAWLAATADTRYPDFVPQVVEMFDSHRAGEIVLFAAEGWTFRPGEPSGHGSCLAADMSVPMFFAGPGVPRGGHIPTARLVDVMPTVVDWLGESDRLTESLQLDGVSLAGPLQEANAAEHP